jgi:hypothetical protein
MIRLCESVRAPVLANLRALASVVSLATLVVPLDTAAQIISPGRLAAPHAGLSGIANCTRCHELGTPGISDARCLDCHAPLADRIREGEGFHASDSTSARCATCHVDHFGQDFQLVRFDTLSFDHNSIGYPLNGAHATADCASCHTPALITERGVLAFEWQPGGLDRTFLGLPTDCTSCHRSDNPHAEQFSGRECSTCHSEEGWEDAPGFDHEATRYPLTGLHASLDCASCHQPPVASGGEAPVVRYAPLLFSECSTCHQDPHAGAMQGSCATCHSTSGWSRVDPNAVEGRFAHASTGFALEGAHDRASCTSCHDPQATRSPTLDLEFPTASIGRVFATPEAVECVSCHIDVHEGALADVPGGSTCLACHGQEQWLPALYGITRHNTDSRFALEGAHLTVACENCHRSAQGALVLEPAFEACVSCHQEDDPHAGQFAGQGCEACHTVDSFLISEFDHAEPLATCASCHQEDDPHEGQFAEQGCEACHTVDSFLIPEFDHSVTDFPLEGGHEGVECAACHQSVESSAGQPFVRYSPLESTCVACHAGAAP